MNLIYTVAVYSGQQRGTIIPSVSRGSEVEAATVALRYLHRHPVSVKSLTRHPDHQKPLSYVLVVKYTLAGIDQNREELVHVYKRHGSLDPEYIRLSNRLAYGINTFECSICQAICLDERAELHPTQQVVCCPGCAQE
jgi:hypothetical protein